MRRRLIILSIFISVGFSNCNRKSVYKCGLDYLSSRPKIESSVLRFDRIAISDTIDAFISGTVYGKYSSKTQGMIDTIIAANVYIVDHMTGNVYSKSTDINGKYQFHLPSSIYNMKVEYLGYNTLIINNVNFGLGDILKFDAILGASGSGLDSSVYTLQADQKFKLTSQSTKKKRK